jgi:hypothetical protein
MNGTIGFRAFNGAVHTLEGYSNDAGKGPQMVSFEIAKFDTFLLIPRKPMAIWQNGWYSWIQRIK